MNESAAGLEQALSELRQHLDAAKVAHMLIGGLALAAWGLPRATLDVDITVWAPPEDTARVINGLLAAFLSRSSNPHGFVERTRVLPLSTPAGIPVDILFGGFPFEREMVHRAVTRTIGSVGFRVATVEDLLLTKLISSRPKDAADVEAILKAHAKALDWTYLWPIAVQLAEAIEMPAMVQRLDPYRPR